MAMIHRSFLARWSSGLGQAAVACKAVRWAFKRRLFQQGSDRRQRRLLVETLEVRRVLDGDQFVMAFRGLTLGATLEEQMQAGQAFLQDHGVSDIQIVAALDLDGT